MKQEDTQQMENNSREYYLANFEKKKLMDEMEEHFMKIMPYEK